MQTSGLQIVFDSLGGLPCIVERNFMEHVVDNVCGANVVMEEIEEAIVPVNSGEGPFHPGPLIFPVEGDRWVCVVEKSVDRIPRVTPNKRTDVPKDN